MLSTTLDLDANPFISTVKKSESAVAGMEGKLGGFGAAFGAVGVAVAGVTAAIAAVAGVVEGFKKVIDLGGELNDLSANTGQSVEDLLILRKAFQNAGLSADMVQPLFAKFQGKLGGLTDDTAPAAEALDKLGLSVDQLKGMSALQQIEALQGGIAKVTDQATRANVLQTLFGKGAGAKLGAVLTDPQALSQAREQLGGLPGLMQKLTPVLDSIGDAIGSIVDKFSQFFAGAIASSAPELEKIFVGISKLDFTGIGKAFGVLVNVFLKLLLVLNPVWSLIKRILDAFNQLTGGKDVGGGQSEAASTGFAETNTTATKKDRFASIGVGSLTASGLNAFNGIGGVALGNDPLVTRADRTNQLLASIDSKMGRAPGGGNVTSVTRPNVPV
jgi:hypothetical protein